MTSRAGIRLAAALAVVIGLVLAVPRPVAGDDDAVAAASRQVMQLIDAGRNRDAERIIVATFDRLAPDLHETWFFFAARTCVSLGSTTCAVGVLSQPFVLEFKPDRIYPQTAGAFLLLHAWVGKMTGDEGGARKLLANGIPRAIVTPLSNPVLFADLALLAAQQARWITDFAQSRQYLDRALAATLSFQFERYDAVGLVLRIVRQHLVNYDAERALRLFIAAEPLFESIPRNSLQRFDFLSLRAELHGYRSDLASAAVDLVAMLRLVNELQIEPETRDLRRAEIYTQLIALEVVRGNEDIAAGLLRLHPLASRRDDIHARGRFASASEFWFAVMEELTDGESVNAGTPGWRRLLEQPIDWVQHPDDVENAEAYARMAASLNRLRRGEPVARTELVNAAYLRLASLHRLARQSVFASPLPSWTDRLLFEVAAAATLASDKPDLGLLLGAHQVLSRSLQSRADDTLSALARQRTDRGRRAVQGLYTTDIERMDWEAAALRTLGERLGQRPSLPATGERLQGPPALVAGRAAILAAADAFGRRQQSFRAALVSPAGGNPDGYLVGVRTLQHQLQPDEALIFYVPTALGQLGKVCLRRDQAIARAEALQATDEADAAQVMRALLSDAPPSTEADLLFPVAAAMRLDRMLLGGLEACLHGARRVHYVPAPGLPRLPPGVLLAEPPPTLGKGYDLRAAGWRVRDHAFVQTSSISAFRASRRLAGTRTAPLDYLGVGDPVLAGAVASLPELPEATQELQAAAALFAPARSRVLLRGDATELRLREAPVADFDILHFATHGLTRGDLPDLGEPGLVLAAGPAGDGLLTASRIATLPLHARLVVLSACNSARNDSSLVDRGIQGLAASFTIAGVPSMIAALWPVESALARDTITATFRTARAAPDTAIADALALAIRRHLDGPTPRPLLHPRFWASLVAIGDGAMNLGDVPVSREVAAP